MKAALLVNVTPTEAMMTQAHLLCRSMARHGGLDFAPIFVIDNHCDEDVVRRENPWLEIYDAAIVRTPKPWNDALGYVGNFIYRLQVDTGADVVLLADADTVVVGDLSVASGFARENRALLGAPAGTWVNDLVWRCLEVGELAHLARDDTPFGPWGIWDASDPARRFTPPHFNCGFLFTHPEVMARLGERILEDTLLCREATGHPLHTQFGLTLALVRSGEAYMSLSPRYNLTIQGGVPAKPAASPWYEGRRLAARDSLRDPRVLHYCVKGHAIEKGVYFANYETLGRLREEPDSRAPFVRLLRDFVRDNYDAMLAEAGR